MTDKIENMLIHDLAVEIMDKAQAGDSVSQENLQHLLEAAITRLPFDERVNLSKKVETYPNYELQPIVKALIEKVDQFDDEVTNHLFRSIYALSHRQQLALFNTYEFEIDMN